MMGRTAMLKFASKTELLFFLFVVSNIVGKFSFVYSCIKSSGWLKKTEYETFYVSKTKTKNISLDSC